MRPYEAIREFSHEEIFAISRKKIPHKKMSTHEENFFPRCPSSSYLILLLVLLPDHLPVEIAFALFIG